MADEAPARPNILIFMTDHQRADTALPEHPAPTPNLDRLGREGVTFTQTYCSAPHCCPARATFWSGLYPSRHGVWNNVCNEQALSKGLADGVRLWSEDLADAGYAMHWLGKWHVSVEESPADRGWT
ncbi:MAG: sulfatase-like hydrolase/transferase, partial [Planctomycetota bacterium]